MSVSATSSPRARLVRAVAHDIRTPLGVLTAAHGQLAAKVGGDAIEGRMLEMAQRAVAQLAHLADRLTMLARLEQGALQKAEARRIELADAAREAVALVQRSRRRRGVTVEIEAGPSLTVDADASVLAAAIAELVDNGLRFAESEVRVRLEERGDRAAVVVEDDGRGFDDQGLARFGIEAPVEGTGGGLGIGTWLVATIVRSLGGSVQVERPSKPCRVVLELPRSEAARPTR